MTRSARFLEFNSIHGLNLLLKSTSRVAKAFWAFVLLAAAAFAAFEFSKLLRQYAAQPVSVQIRVSNVEKIPQLLVCPAVWASRERMGTLGDPAEVYKFWLMHNLDIGTEDGNSLHPGMGMLDPGHMFDQELREFLVEDQENHTRVAERINDRYPTITDFLMDVSLDPIEVFAQRYPHIIYPHLKVPNSHCVCYELNVHFQIPKFLLPFQEFELLLKHHEPILKLGRRSHRIYVGAGRPNMLLDGLEVASGNSYRIYLAASNSKSVNTPRNPCASYGLDEWQMCGFECLNTIVCNKCHLIDVNKSMNFSGVCALHDFYLGRGHCLMNYLLRTANMPEMMERCWNQCPIPCETWRYSYSVIPADDLVNGNYTILRMRMFQALWSPHLIESYSYNWPDLLASVGGILPLFFGASIISLVHIVEFSIEQLRESCKTQKSKA